RSRAPSRSHRGPPPPGRGDRTDHLPPSEALSGEKEKQMSLFPSKKNSKSFGARNLCVATLAALGVVFLFSRAQAETEAPTERFFFAVGANDGGPQRARLRYAGRDASSMAAVMRELGGVRVENLILLEEPNRRSFRAAWNEVR